MPVQAAIRPAAAPGKGPRELAAVLMLLQSVDAESLDVVFDKLAKLRVNAKQFLRCLMV
jgi:hypothetical protein